MFALYMQQEEHSRATIFKDKTFHAVVKIFSKFCEKWNKKARSLPDLGSSDSLEPTESTFPWRLSFMEQIKTIFIIQPPALIKFLIPSITWRLCASLSDLVIIRKKAPKWYICTRTQRTYQEQSFKSHFFKKPALSRESV